MIDDIPDDMVGPRRFERRSQDPQFSPVYRVAAFRLL